MEILRNIPVWGWPLFVGLVLIGLRAMRERRVPVWLIYALPLLGLLGVRSVLDLQVDVSAWLAFVVLWLGSAYLGYRLANRIILGRDGGRVHLKGEWVTLAALMVLFFSNFSAGLLAAVAPEVLQHAFGAAVFAGVLAAASGQFAGRALRVFRG